METNKPYHLAPKRLRLNTGGDFGNETTEHT
jgi:hypothetical protein